MEKSWNCVFEFLWEPCLECSLYISREVHFGITNKDVRAGLAQKYYS